MKDGGYAPTDNKEGEAPTWLTEKGFICNSFSFATEKRTCRKLKSGWDRSARNHSDGCG